MKRILKFILVFILVTVVLLGSIVWFGWDAFRTLHENREGMAEGSEWIEETYSMSGLVQFIGNHNSYVSLQNETFILPIEGETEYSLQLNASRPRAAGLVNSIYLMAAYAEEFGSGGLNPTESIAFDELSKWQLPGVHEQAHQSLREIAEGSYPDLLIPLSVLVSWVPASSDLALYDYLLHKIGSEKISLLYEKAGLTQTEKPVPYSGLYLVASEWFDGSMSPFSEPEFRIRKQEGFEETDDRNWIHDYAWKRAIGFQSGETYTETWERTLRDKRLGLTFMQERDALVLFPQTTSSDLSHFTKQLIAGNLLSKEASEQVFTWLSWAGLKSESRFNPSIQILQTGSLYDSRMGLLSGLHLVRTQDVDGKNETVMIQTAIFESLPVGLWFHLSANHMHQDFLQRLLTDSTLIRQTSQMISTLEQNLP